MPPLYTWSPTSFRFHRYKTVSTHKSTHLVELALLQKHFEQQDERSHGWELVHQLPSDGSCLWAVGHVKADVHAHATRSVIKLDQRNLGTADDLVRTAMIPVPYIHCPAHRDVLANALPTECCCKCTLGVCQVACSI